MSRSITSPQRNWLDDEVTAWRALGLLSEEQAQSILGLYPSRESFQLRQQSRGLLTVLALAASFVGLGVLLLIGYNWSEMSATLKVVAVFGAVIGTHATGGILRFQLGWRRLSEVAFFLGCLFYGAAMWLLAQIFNISSSSYDALWWWAVGTLPFALLVDTLLLHLLYAGLLAAWVGFEVLSLERILWGLPSGAYSLPFLAAAGFWWAYRNGSAKALGIYVPLLAWWVVLLPIAWKLQANPTYLIGAIGSLMLLVAAMHPSRSEMAIPYRFYRVALVCATLIPLSFKAFNDEMLLGPSANASPISGIEQMLIILLVAILTLAFGYILQRKTAPSGGQPTPSIGNALRDIIRRQAVPCSLLGLFAFLAVWAPAASDVWIPTIAANVAMVFVAFWLIRLGLHEDRTLPFSAGTAYLLLWAVLRYIDLFGAFGGMIGAALVFFLCGAALFGVALYWRHRKAVTLD
jgi:uncharacterized membrane protein